VEPGADPGFFQKGVSQLVNQQLRIKQQYAITFVMKKR